jgi:hypothetical protein
MKKILFTIFLTLKINFFSLAQCVETVKYLVHLINKQFKSLTLFNYNFLNDFD